MKQGITPFRAIVLTLGFAFLYIPIVSLIVYSFNASRLVTVWGGFSTRWYGALFRNEQILNAAWLSINDVADAWVAAIEEGKWTPDGREKQLAFGLKSIPPEKAARVLGKLLPDKLPADGAGNWIEIIGDAGNPTDLKKLYDQTLAKGFNPPALARALDALNAAARNRSRPFSIMPRAPTGL